MSEESRARQAAKTVKKPNWDKWWNIGAPLLGIAIVILQNSGMPWNWIMAAVCWVVLIGLFVWSFMLHAAPAFKTKTNRIIFVILYGLVWCTVAFVSTAFQYHKERSSTGALSDMRQAYIAFEREKIRHIDSFAPGVLLLVKMNLDLGMLKSGKLTDVETQGTNRDFESLNQEYEKWIRDKSAIEQDFSASLAAVRATFPNTKTLNELIDEASRIYKPKILDVPPLVTMEEKQNWLNAESARMNKELSENVKEPINRLSQYLDSTFSQGGNVPQTP